LIVGEAWPYYFSRKDGFLSGCNALSNLPAS
jgi:hypothetical protein